jgi:hypothetical protein
MDDDNNDNNINKKMGKHLNNNQGSKTTANKKG